MNQDNYPGHERRIKGTLMVESMRHDRAALLKQLRALGKRYPFEGSNGQPYRPLVRFCQAMGAYIALSHFGPFYRIGKGEERRAEIRRVALDVYPDIERSTHEMLAFVERYKRVDPSTLDRSFTRALSALARSLSERFELEDQLLTAIDEFSDEKAVVAA